MKKKYKKWLGARVEKVGEDEFSLSSHNIALVF